ncbi:MULTISPECIES: MFS transporter [Enterococcus]|uniref:MFS transporter n=1 Tax=Enterococcus TaxID=1350 RepID=UPI000763CDE1|nr:MFS transporter [Enterococcus casseliflavus]OJG28957.1 fucose permease [Enterococcus casseliflavus]QQU21545.1 MFS transporter [Enterococcus casseliflavus]STR02310.1 Major Facilitator Superfamily [Enterococcus casseliflavus]
MKLSYKHTLYACFSGYICQAIVSNLPPLLFVIFQSHLGITLENITFLITLGFFIQIAIDILAARIVDRFGYRISMTIANIFCLFGLISLGVLPYYIDPFTGLLFATILNAIGGGFQEVVVSPIVEALPGDEKSGSMGILHSFYCWGYVGIVLFSTIYFYIFGQNHWGWLPIISGIVPLINLFLFLKVPLRTLVDKDKQVPAKVLLLKKSFWILIILMICSGAAEQAMSKWSSFFAEVGLGTSKTTGDLLGPFAFALLMGITRVIYGKKAKKYDLRLLIACSGLLCIFSYLLVTLSPIPYISLLGCALTGLSIAILWPASISLASSLNPYGGNTMFGILALGGDIGCAIGPSMVGVVSNMVINSNSSFVHAILPGNNMTQLGLKVGLFSAIIFPVIIVISIIILRSFKEKEMLHN